MDIGKKIKELRVATGLTQEELADRSELSKGFISQLERDLTSPSIATLMDILQCLGTTVSEFFQVRAGQIRSYFEMKTILRKLILNLAARPNGIIPNAQKKYDGTDPSDSKAWRI